MISEDEAFRSRLPGYSPDELRDVEANLDRERYPARYLDLMAEIEARRKNPRAWKKPAWKREETPAAKRWEIRKARAVFLAFAAVMAIWFSISELQQPELTGVAPSRGEGDVVIARWDSTLARKTIFGDRYHYFFVFALDGIPGYFRYESGDPEFAAVKKAARGGGRLSLAYYYDARTQYNEPVEVVRGQDTILRFETHKSGKRMDSLLLLAFAILMTVISAAFVYVEFFPKKNP